MRDWPITWASWSPAHFAEVIIKHARENGECHVYVHGARALIQTGLDVNLIDDLCGVFSGRERVDIIIKKLINAFDEAMSGDK